MEPNVSTIPMAMSASAPQVSLVFRAPGLEIACNLNTLRGGQRNVSLLSFPEMLLVCCEVLSTPLRQRIVFKYRKPFTCDSDWSLQLMGVLAYLFQPHLFLPRRWQLLLFWLWNPWAGKQQCEAFSLWFTFLYSKSDCTVYSWRTRDGQSSTTVYSDFCCVRLFNVKRGRLKCSKNCVHWKKYHRAAACQNVVKMISRALYRRFDRAVDGTEVGFLMH